MLTIEQEHNFNGLVVMYKLLEPNANRNQFTCLNDLLREINFNIFNYVRMKRTLRKMEKKFKMMSIICIIYPLQS